MRTLAACTHILALSAAALAEDKPIKWEYGELVVRNVPARPARKDPQGNETPAVPASMMVHWTSAAGEYNVKGWDELAEKIKAKIKEGTPSSQKIQMLNALGSEGWELIEQQGATPNLTTGAFGGAAAPEGLGQPGGGGRISAASTTTMLFKRRVP